MYYLDCSLVAVLVGLVFDCLPDAVNLMVAVAEAMGSVHVLDFVPVHDAEVMVVHVDAVHVVRRVPIANPAPLVAVATVAIDLLDTVGTKRKNPSGLENNNNKKLTEKNSTHCKDDTNLM